MTTDFKSEALAFVHKHHCAATAPVELIEAAMEHGAEMALADVNQKLEVSLTESKALREARNGHPDSRIYEPSEKLADGKKF